MGPDVKNYSLKLYSNPNLLDAFVKYALSDKKFAWRAAWIVYHYAVKKPREMNKYAQYYIDILNEISGDGHIRELLKTVMLMNLSEKQTCKMFDFCFSILQNNKLQSSVRLVALKFLTRISEDYPELKNEIEIIFENIKDYLSPGIKRSMEMKIKQIT